MKRSLFEKCPAAIFGLLLGLVIHGSVAIAESKPPIPRRLISLSPAATENIYRLEVQDHLLANTIYCAEPPEARMKEKIGTFLQANLERIVSLQPDLVVASSLLRREQVEKLRQVGIRVEVFPYPKSFSEICTQFLRLGEILGRTAKAQAIIDAVEREVSLVRARTRALPKKRVFFQIGIRPLHTVTAESFLNDYIQFAGGINIAGHEVSGLYSREKVILSNPEVIIITTMGMAGEKEREGWSRYGTLSAVKARNVHIVNPEKVCSPTPTTFVESLMEIARMIHPELS